MGQKAKQGNKQGRKEGKEGRTEQKYMITVSGVSAL